MSDNGLWRLRLTMAAMVAIIIAITTLALTAILWFFDALDLYTLIALTATFNIAQWLLAPYLVNFMYNVKQAQPGERPELKASIERVAQNRA